MKQCSFWFSFCIALGMCLLTATTVAAPADMYKATVTVQSQSAAERARAASEGLRQVLVRVSGVVDLNAAGDVEQVLGNASGYIDQFQYKRGVDDYGDRVEQLVMSFSPKVIEGLLQQAGLPLWPTNRPSVLVWLVEDDPQGGRQLVNTAEDDVVKGLRKGAAMRGLQLKWPLLDLDDQLAISAEDVWTFEQEAIVEASERYRVDTVLVGRYTQTSGGQWWTSWQFFHRGDSEFYELRLADGIELGAQAIDPLADNLASRYSVYPGGEGEPQMMVQISNVDSFGDYRGALEYLRQVAVVTSTELLAVTGSTLLVVVQLSGDTQQLENALSLDKKLRREAVATPPQAPWIAVPAGTPANPLRLEWTGR